MKGRDTADVTGTFRDIETYAAYLYLVAGFWEEMRKSGAQPGEFAGMAGEFRDMVLRNAAFCSARDATRWLGILEGEPFTRLVVDGAVDLKPVLEVVRERIPGAADDAVRGDPGEALEWIRFIGTRNPIHYGRDRYVGWAADALSPVCRETVPDEIAREAYRILVKVALDDGPWRGISEALGGIRLPKEKSLWGIGSFRAALWSSVMNAEGRDSSIRECLKDAFVLVKGDARSFSAWAKACGKLSASGVHLWSAEERASEGAVGHDEGRGPAAIQLLYFYTPLAWPCQNQSPIVKRLADRLDGRVLVTWVRTDEEKNAAMLERHRVKAVPSLVVLVNGTERRRYEDVQGEERLVSDLAGLLEEGKGVR